MSTLSGKREASVNRHASSINGQAASVHGHDTSATNNLEEISVVIVGAGQRGLSTLERLCSFYPTYTNAPCLRVHVVDPGHPGQGSHREAQPSHLLTNTSTAQITIFVDSSVQDSGPARTGPSYGEWLSQSGYRWKDGGIVRNDNGDPIHPDTYTSRALLGCYLRWCFEHIRAEAPEGVIIENHRSEAIDIQRRGEGNGFVISLEGEGPIEADYVFVTTGHASGSTSKADERTLANVQALRSRNPHLRFIPSAAAFGDLEAIESTAKVLICGTGLSAADALSVLTAGRGGRFEADGDRRLRYVISGREPNITLYSRQGLPPGAKGVNQRALGEDYEPKYFTSGFIAAKRRERDGGQLNWKEDIHPCLIREVEHCWLTASEQRPTSVIPPPFHLHHRESVSDIVHSMLYPWDAVKIRSREQHLAFLRSHIAADVDAAFVGNVSHPAKAVAEMLRDLNDVVREAVNYASLDEHSHRASFLGSWVSVNNRLAAGAPKERNMQLLALMDAGIVDVFEPRPDVILDAENACYTASTARFGYVREESFDVLVRARIAPFHLELSPSPFFATGRDEGIFTIFRNGSFEPGGIAIDRSLNVINAHGKPIETMWAMGHAVEGANYYTNVLPCPLSNSVSLRDAATAARGMLEHVTQNAGRRHNGVNCNDRHVIMGEKT